MLPSACHGDIVERANGMKYKRVLAGRDMTTPWSAHVNKCLEEGRNEGTIERQKKGEGRGTYCIVSSWSFIKEMIAWQTPKKPERRDSSP